MNKKIIEKNNNTKEEVYHKKDSKHKDKAINLHLVRRIKGHLGVKSLKEIHLSNILNLKVKDVEDIEIGKRELSLKDINIICNAYNINPDNLFEEFLKNK